MIGFRSGQIMKANFRQGATTPGIFTAGPAQGRIKIVTSVHKHRACVELIGNICGAIKIRRPQRSGQPVLAVIHQCNGLGVIMHFHDANHRAKAFFLHDRHAVINIKQNLRHKIGPFICGESCRVDQCFGTAANSIIGLRPHQCGKSCMRHWPQTGVAVQRITQLIAVDDGHGMFNKLIKNRLGNIDLNFFKV